MGTVTNGKKWAGACVNGKVVSGLVKNGVVFYRRPVSTYRRRIMVGDSLGGKFIYSDFPTGYYSTFPSGTNSFTTLVESNGTSLIYENIINSPEYIEITSDEMLRGNTPYQYDDGEETITGEMTIDDYDTFNVTNITDNSSYRHLFIEDENVRPVQVGDVITSTTKFYFTFPDDFYGYIENNISPGKRLKIVELDNSIGGKFISVENYQGITSTFYLVAFFVNNSSTSDRHIYNYNTNSSLINKSNMTSAFSGTVTNVNKNNQSYQHILVDTTTLGS